MSASTKQHNVILRFEIFPRAGAIQIEARAELAVFASAEPVAIARASDTLSRVFARQDDLDISINSVSLEDIPKEHSQ